DHGWTWLRRTNVSIGTRMLRYILRRILILIPTVLAISLITFVIIQLPPGDYLTTVQASLAEAGDQPLDAAELARLTERYGLNDPWYVQYWKWLSGIVFHGDFGDSFSYGCPVIALVWD